MTTITTTLAVRAHTCRERAARLVEQADEWEAELAPRRASSSRDAAADWQALADLVHGLSLNPDTNRRREYIAAAKRLAARLDRP